MWLLGRSVRRNDGDVCVHPPDVHPRRAPTSRHPPTVTKTDGAVLALTAFALLMAVMGVSDPTTWGSIPLLWAIAALTVNGGWTLWKGSRDSDRPRRREQMADDVTLDTHQILEIDQRLETLERRDTQRVRELISWNEVDAATAPLAGLPDSPIMRRDRA